MSELLGGKGPSTQPAPRTSSLYKVGAKRPGSRGPLIPFIILTNGDIVYADEKETVSEGKLATAVVPAICIKRAYMHPDGNVKGDDQYDAFIESFMSDTYDKDKSFEEEPNIHKTYEWIVSTATAPYVSRQRGPRLYDSIVKDYKGRGQYVFETRDGTHIMTTEFEMKQMLLKINSWISDALMFLKAPQTRWALLGLCQVSQDNMTVQRFPTMKFKYVERYEGEIWRPKTTNQVKDQAYYYFWLKLLAEIIKHAWPIGGYADYDYMALAWQIVYQESGIGDNKMPDEMNDDPATIYEKIMPRMFNDSNDAYVYEFQTSEQLMHYWTFHIIKAIVVANCKAETQDVTLRLTGGKDKSGVGMLKMVMTADYEDFGSSAGLWYIPARTLMGEDLALPCLVRKEPDAGTKAMINDWVRITPVVGDTFTTAKVEHMELMSDVFDPKENKEMYVLYDLSTNDARVEKIAFKRETAIVFRLRYHGITAKFDSQLSEIENKKAFLLAQLCGCPNVFKKGYIVDKVPNIHVQPSLINVLKELPPFEGAILEKTPRGSQAEVHATQSPQPSPPPLEPVLEVKAVPRKTAEEKTPAQGSA